MDDIFLAVFAMEFALKVYTQPIQYWKDYFNLLDFAVLVTFISQTVLELVYHQHQWILVVNVMKGTYSVYFNVPTVYCVRKLTCID